MVSMRVRVPTSVIKGARSPGVARQLATQWAREYADARGLGKPTVKLEHDGWQAYFPD